MRAVGRNVVVMFALGMLAASCSRSLDVDGLEATLAQQIGESLHRTVTVSCPSEIEVDAGDTFECVATGEDRTSVRIQVTQENDKGSVLWQVVGTASEQG